MAYDSKLGDRVNLIRRLIGDTQSTQLLSDDEIKGLIREYAPEGQTIDNAVAAAHLSIAADEAALQVLMERVDGFSEIEQLRQARINLAEVWTKP